MSPRLSFGSALLQTAAVFVAFLLAFAGSVAARNATISFPQCGKNAPQAVFSGASTAISGVVDVSVPDDIEFAVEDQDPIETLRVDIDEGPLGIDRVTISAKIRSTLANNAIPSLLSPQLE